MAAVLGALSIIALVWWFGSLWRRMAVAEGGNHRLSVVALAGLVGGVACFAVSTAVLATVAIQVDEVSAEGAKFFFVLSSALLAFAAAFLTAHLAAVCALSLRSRFLPKWVTWLGLLAALLFLISTLGTTTDADPVMIFGFVAFIAWVVWIVAVSIHMWRTAELTTAHRADPQLQTL